jgi:hypothetical protein
MAYSFGDWGLYTRDVMLRTHGKTQRIYYFSKGAPKSGSPTDLPPGYVVGVSTRTGMPYLKKAAASGWH